MHTRHQNNPSECRSHLVVDVTSSAVAPLEQVEKALEVLFKRAILRTNTSPLKVCGITYTIYRIEVSLSEENCFDPWSRKA